MGKDREIMTQNVSEIVKQIRMFGPEFPTMIWGPPGIGKTHALLDEFKDHEIVLVLAGCSEPTDISGIPFEMKHNGEAVATKILAPLWAYYASTEAPPEWINRKMVIFFDDIPSGHEQTQAACFKVFGEHRVGNLKLRDDVYIIAAGNRVEDKSAAFEMPLALANRMKHYYAKSDPDSWVEWATTHGINPWVVGFIRYRPELLNQFEEAIKLSSTEKAIATPRTWAMLSKGLEKIESKGGVTSNLVYPLATGCVGSGVALEFTTFTKCSSKLVKPEDIVKNPSTARIPSKTEVDVLFATVSSLEYYINLPENHKHWDKALEYVLRPELEAEFGLLIAKAATVIALSKLPEEERHKAPQNQWFKKMYTLYGKYLANPEG